MSSEQRPLKVFLCHAHEDREAIRTLYTRLKREGVDAWLDKEKLLPGADWEFEIRKAVGEADVIIVCLSKHFSEAGFRQKEVRLALDTAMEQPEGEIFIIPARLEECENLQSLSKWHWVDLFEGDGYQRLIQALRARAERIGATLPRRGLSVTDRPKSEQTKKTFEPLAKDIDSDNAGPNKMISSEVRVLKNPETEDHEDAEKVSREKPNHQISEHAALEKAKSEKSEHLAVRKAVLKNVHLVKFLVFSGIIIILLGAGSVAIYRFMAAVPTAQATNTLRASPMKASANSPFGITETVKPSETPTKTSISTLTPTPIIVSRSDIFGNWLVTFTNCDTGKVGTVGRADDVFIFLSNGKVENSDRLVGNWTLEDNFIKFTLGFSYRGRVIGDKMIGTLGAGGICWTALKQK